MHKAGLRRLNLHQPARRGAGFVILVGANSFAGQKARLRPNRLGA